MVTRSQCHLCDEMTLVLDRVFGELDVLYETIDVDADSDLLGLYGDSVPVLLRDDRPVAKVRVSERQLRRIVDRRRFLGRTS